MRKIIASENISLDGYFAAKDEGFDWFSWNDEMERSAIELMGTVDMMLFGRTTYEMMAEYWPKAKPPAENQAIIDFMNNGPKIVYSNRLEKADWNNSMIVKGVKAEEVQTMKSLPGKDLVIFGSGTILKALMKLGLVDELHLLVNPVILGGGKPLFEDPGGMRKLDLLRTQGFGNGVVLLRYKFVA